MSATVFAARAWRDRANGKSYLFEGKDEPFTRRLERIGVKGGPEIVQEVLGTRHGVVFNSLLQTNRSGEALVHRDPVNPLLIALLPIAIKVADEDQVEDPGVKRLVNTVRDWDLRAETLAEFPAVAALRNVMTPYRGSGLNDVYGAGMGGVTNLARRLAADFAGDGTTPRGERERAYLKKWLQASAQGTSGRGRGAGATDDWTARIRQGAPEAVGQTITIPYQGMTPLKMPTVDSSLDIVSPPLTCLDTGTIWSQPGNFYTQIVDLADIDNSRAMIAPGNCEDGTSPLRTAGIDLWVQGRTRPAPLSRDKVEKLGCATTRLESQSYEGPLAAPALTVDKADPAAQFLSAIPAVEPASDVVEPRPRPAEAQKPDDPQLEAAFRVILRPSGTPNEEVDAQLAEIRKYVEGKPELLKQLRGAAVLGIYLIEESSAGRLKVQYGSPYVLRRLREVLKELGDVQEPPASPPAAPDKPPAPEADAASGLLGYWPLRGDCQDHSGNGLHAVNHGVKLDDGTFDGRGAYLEIPANRELQMGTKDFSFAACVHTDKHIDDVIGDVVSLYNPQGGEERCDQIHALEVYRGQLHATTWPKGHVCRLEASGGWTDLGRLGDALEINALSVYNGQLYGGTIPRAEVFRYNPTIEPGKPVPATAPEPKPQRRVRRPAAPPESASAAWTSVRRFLDPASYEFKDSNEWARVTSLTTRKLARQAVFSGARRAFFISGTTVSRHNA